MENTKNQLLSKIRDLKYEISSWSTTNNHAEVMYLRWIKKN